jgi:hypothetical protein
LFGGRGLGSWEKKGDTINGGMLIIHWEDEVEGVLGIKGKWESERWEAVNCG